VFIAVLSLISCPWYIKIAQLASRLSAICRLTRFHDRQLQSRFRIPHFTNHSADISTFSDSTFYFPQFRMRVTLKHDRTDGTASNHRGSTAMGRTWFESVRIAMGRSIIVSASQTCRLPVACRYSWLAPYPGSFYCYDILRYIASLANGDTGIVTSVSTLSIEVSHNSTSGVIRNAIQWDIISYHFLCS